MRKFTFIISTFVILTSCSNDKSSTADNSSNQIDSLKQTFIPIFKGVWVLSDYIKEIEKTKSPLKSAYKLQDVVTMIIDGKTQSDSMEVGASWNNHEGYSFMTYFVAGQNSKSLKTNIPDYDENSNFYELGYETINDETFLFLYHYNKSNKLIDKKSFTKIAHEQDENDAALGLQRIVNEQIFSGNYLIIDSANQSSKITFNSDGSLIGNSDLKTYHVFTDFMGGPETVLDGIAFNIDSKKSLWLAFKYSTDTIYLYTTKGDEEAGEQIQFDKVLYKLARQQSE